MDKRILFSRLSYIAVAARNLLLANDRLDMPTDRGKPVQTLAAMIRIKNEARFLPELLAYHLELGFQHFYLYDNCSSDNPAAVLAPFLEMGLVTLIDWPVVPASPQCYHHFWKTHAAQAQWVAFIDADEFIVEAEDGLLLRHLREIEASTPALALMWRYFGGSGHERTPEGLIIDALQRSSATPDSHVKVIVRPQRVHSPFNPHNFIYRRAALARTVDGQLVAGSHGGKARDLPLRINHYVYRSRENYLAKTKQGFADARGAQKKVRRNEQVETEFHKHNDIENGFVAERYGARVRARLRALGYGSPFV